MAYTEPLRSNFFQKTGWPFYPFARILNYKIEKRKKEMIKVFQIQLTDEEIDAINNGEETERSKAYFGREFIRTFDPANFKHYDHVANVDAANAEEAFSLMNLWDDESKIERLGRCSSMSVGDIVEVDGELYRCASFGFDKLAIQNVEIA
jgi:hypothetical protein